MSEQVRINSSTLRRDLFSHKPLCSCLVAYPAQDQSRMVGYALFYPIYSTWEGVAMYLEDLYVTPDHRGNGLGKRMWQTVTKIALDTDCSRLHLAVLGWNSLAKDYYYQRVGCIDLTEKEEWHLMRLQREDMETFVKDFKCEL